MKYDLYAEYEQNTLPCTAHPFQIVKVEGAKNKRYKELDPRKDRRGYLYEVKNNFKRNVKEEKTFLENLSLEKPNLTSLNLSTHYFFLQFKFKLRKPYISRDDDPFYSVVNENPIRKDKAFKVPMVSPTAWKGNLRWAMMKARLEQGQDKDKFAEERLRQALLFGPEKGTEDTSKGWADYLNKLEEQIKPEKTYPELLNFHFGLKTNDQLPNFKGRLHFYPTFFNDIDLEVINPHDRKKGVSSKGPIYFECVPAGTSGCFSLLYFPFDLIGREDEYKEYMREDIKAILEAVKAMFLDYGFSAKKLVGYGVAKEKEFKEVDCKSNILNEEERRKIKEDIEQWSVEKSNGGGK